MKDKIKAIFCVLFGHSRIQSVCFGYVYCGRCNQQLGDMIAASYSVDGVVIIGHECCPKCETNMKSLTWRDKLFVKKPTFKAPSDDGWMEDRIEPQDRYPG